MLRTRTALLFSLVCVFACERGNPSEPAPAASARREVAPKERPFRFGAADRVVAVGDLHGDLEAARAALRLAGAIDGEDRWIGGKLVVVQVGDQLSRGDDERPLLDLLARLEQESRGAGGALHVLIGNHELMNTSGDFRYATAAGFAAFSEFAAELSSEQAQALKKKERGRAAAFGPGGRYRKQIAERDAVVQVGDSVFAHGGLRPEHVRYGVARVNAELRQFLRGELSAPPDVAAGPESPLWDRSLGAPSPKKRACVELAQALELLQAQRLVVGHTVQENGITSACDGMVWRIDVGLGAHYGPMSTEILEIARDGTVRVLGKKQPTQRAPAETPAPAP
jgi:hypothetical protein